MAQWSLLLGWLEHGKKKTEKKGKKSEGSHGRKRTVSGLFFRETMCG